jgi:hypothetical protein
MAYVWPVFHRLSCSNQIVRNAPKYEFWFKWSGSGALVVKNYDATAFSNLCVNSTSSDEDIATNDTSTPTPVSTSTTPLGPITRARGRRLTHQVSSLLSLGSSYLENGDTCTLVLLRNHGLDQKGKGIAQAGFGLQDRHDL